MMCLCSIRVPRRGSAHQRESDNAMFTTKTGPHGIDLAAPGGVEKLLAFHRGVYGHARMDADDAPAGPGGSGSAGSAGATTTAQPAGPERPEGVSEDEWSALGDPGKRAIVRERERATRAERELAAARAPKPTPPKGKDADTKTTEKHPEPGDVAALIQQAVTAAMRPFQEREEQREAEGAAQAVAAAVTDAAAGRLHDSSDALAHVDLSTLTDGTGRPDPAKITAALDDLVKRKPHLGKVVDDRRRPEAGSFIGGGAAAAVSLDDQVKSALAKMQATAGVKFAGSE